MIPGQQISMFDYDFRLNLVPDEPIKMPDWDEYKDMVAKSKALDEVMDKLPKYLVTFRKPVFGLPYPYKKKICVYVGYWHSIDGWNYMKPKELLNVESWEPVKYKKGDPYSFNDTDYPYRFQCMTNCDVEWCSLICFERRGAIYDRVERKFCRDEHGNLLKANHRTCSKGVYGSEEYFEEERSNT